MSKLKKFWHQATVAPFAAVLGLFGILGGVRTLVDPSSLPIEPLVGTWLVPVWSVLAVLGGLGIIIGAGIRSTATEAAGCVMFAGAVVVEAIAFGAYLGVGFNSVWSIVNLGLFAIAALLRTKRLVRGQHLVWLTVMHEERE